jgi:hypothetical protein
LNLFSLYGEDLDYLRKLVELKFSKLIETGSPTGLKLPHISGSSGPIVLNIHSWFLKLFDALLLKKSQNFCLLL